MKLNELCKIKHGFAFKGKDIIKDHVTKYVLVTPGNFNIGGGFKANKCKYFSESGEIPKDYILKENDLIVTMTDLSVKSDTLGYSALIPHDENNIYLHNQRIGLVYDIDETKVLKEYLYWFMRTRTYQQNVVASQSGTAIHHTSPDRILDIDIELPGLVEQRKVVKVLFDIENKIKLNIEINNNLFAIASNLINNYFDDNHDKIQYKEVIKFIKGKKPKDITAIYQEGYEKYLTIACLNGEENNYANPDKMLMTERDVLMVMDGASSGDTYFSSYGIVGSTLSKIEIVNENYIPEYVFFTLKKYKCDIQGQTTGSAIPHTNKEVVLNLEIPNIEITEQLRFKSLLEQILHNNEENVRLSELRDTLLPKLMNGEINLDNIEI